MQSSTSKCEYIEICKGDYRMATKEVRFRPARMAFVYLLWNLTWILPVTVIKIDFIMKYMTDFAYSYLEDFAIIGIVGCVFLGRQKLKEFSSQIFTKQNGFILLINILFCIGIVLADAYIGHYEVVWMGLIKCAIDAILFNGFVEEWVFRGYFVNQFSKIIASKRKIVLITAVLFSFMHLPNYCLVTEEITIGGIIYRLLIPFLMGIALAIIFLKTRNLFVCSLTHGIYNLISYVTDGWWMYVCYGIYWIMIVLYILYCYKIQFGSLQYKHRR